jgi:pimeloyl-ACP methyl ester carboxylesterase
VAGRNNTVISWAPLLVALAGRTGVLAYDRAGLGASDPAPTPVTLEQQVAAVVDEVANGRCVLAGHSWGGILAQLLAFKCPGLVSGLVLIDPGHEDMVAGLPASARWLLRTTDPWLRAALRAPVLASPLARVQARRAAARLGAGPDIRSLIADAYLEAAGCPDELAGISADPPLLRAVRAAPQPFPNVPVTVLSATRGAPRRMRAHWTALQAALAAQA